MSAVGVGCAVAAGLALATSPTGLVAGVVVGALLAARLACANLDGGLARATRRSTPRGSLVNEVSDRAADLAALAGLAAHADPRLVLLAALGASLPSWVALAGAAAGAPRVQGGPLGKTERCVLLVLAAFLGHAGWVAAAIAFGGVVTGAVRLVGAWRALGSDR